MLAVLRRLPVLLAAVAAVAVATVGLALPAHAASHPNIYIWTATATHQAGWELDSSDGSHRVVFQSDHNLVVYHGSKATWSSKTNGSTYYEFSTIANDTGGKYLPGNIGVYFTCLTPCTYQPSKGWSNGVNSAQSAYRLVMQGDGNFVEYSGRSGGKALWASGTNGK